MDDGLFSISEKVEEGLHHMRGRRMRVGRWMIYREQKRDTVAVKMAHMIQEINNVGSQFIQVHCSAVIAINSCRVESAKVRRQSVYPGYRAAASATEIR